MIRTKLRSSDQLHSDGGESRVFIRR
jgi:hypothetical protein